MPSPSKEWTLGDFCIHFFQYSPSFLPVSCRFVSLLLSKGLVPSAVFCALNLPELADRNNDILQQFCNLCHSIGNTENCYPLGGTGWDVSPLEIPAPSLPHSLPFQPNQVTPTFHWCSYVHRGGEKRSENHVP